MLHQIEHKAVSPEWLTAIARASNKRFFLKKMYLVISGIKHRTSCMAHLSSATELQLVYISSQLFGPAPELSHFFPGRRWEEDFFQLRMTAVERKPPWKAWKGCWAHWHLYFQHDVSPKVVTNEALPLTSDWMAAATPAASLFGEFIAFSMKSSIPGLFQLYFFLPPVLPNVALWFLSFAICWK